MVERVKKSLILLIGICVTIYCSACQSSSNIVEQSLNEGGLKYGYSRYQDGIFGFSVDFPVTWTCESEPYSYGTEVVNGDPDSGIWIYIDNQKENYIRISEYAGKITSSYAVQSNFTKTSIDENRVLYIKESGEIFEAQFFLKGHDHMIARIRMETKLYKKHEEEIINLLKSINSQR